MKAYTQPDNIKEIEEKLEKIIKEKDDAVHIQDFEKAAKLRDSQREIEEKLQKEKKKWENKNSRAVITLNEEDNVVDVLEEEPKQISKMSLKLQFIVMEKMTPVIQKTKFGKIKMTPKILVDGNEKEILNSTLFSSKLYRNI